MKPYQVEVELKPLRKNAKNAYFKVCEMDNNGCYSKITAYETMREAVYHAMSEVNGDILTAKGKALLKAFYCKASNRMVFGFQADQWERSLYSQDLWWASFK